ncbi:hypothetical protein [Alkalicoccus luteus]|uniref:Lipoprotein n=1 Tax=Alkalicoccus luteus TaxID=1237094 RepID=A0A969PU27_9BACI|nr:hypothetical protein [Alkalicoccus luteus]NJP37549.1 hypothetical protein [Alkalicoccus luteus]
MRATVFLVAAVSVSVTGCAMQEENQIQAYAEDSGETVYVLATDNFEKTEMDIQARGMTQTYEEVDGLRKLDLQHGYGELLPDHFRMYIEDDVDVYSDSPELSIVEAGPFIGRYHVNHTDGYHSYHFIEKNDLPDLTEDSSGTRIAVSRMEEEEFWQLVDELKPAE